MPTPFNTLGLGYLKQYARENPVAAGILSAAIACFVAVALIGSLGIEPNEEAVWPVVYVLAIGLPLYLLTSLLSSVVARTAGGVFVALLIVGWIFTFIAFKLDPSNARLACLVNFWQTCGATSDMVASETASRPALTTLSDLKTTLRESPQDIQTPRDAQIQFRVFIQFAGFQRPTIVDLAKLLSSLGWDVKGAAQGGERIASAAGLREVRYREAKQKPAAEALASTIGKTRVTTRPVRAVANRDIKPDVLEVWISQ